MDSKHKNGLQLFNDAKHIIHRFPSYKQYNTSFTIPNLIDNANYYVLKPKGRKSYLWFTYYKKDLLCLLLFLPRIIMVGQKGMDSISLSKKKCEGLQIIEDPYNLVVMFSRKDRAHFL
jgi:hypothetical protein